MAELKKDPKVVRAILPRLAPGETVLWASAQHGLGRRGVVVLGSALAGNFAICAIMVLFARAPFEAIVYPLSFSAPFLGWWVVEMMARSFIATDRRIIFLSRVWPRRRSYWNYADLNVPLVEVGRNKKIIHLSHFIIRGHDEPAWVYNLAVYPTYIEQVPDIEAVRSLILE